MAAPDAFLPWNPSDERDATCRDIPNTGSRPSDTPDDDCQCRCPATSASISATTWATDRLRPFVLTRFDQTLRQLTADNRERTTFAVRSAFVFRCEHAVEGSGWTVMCPDSLLLQSRSCRASDRRSASVPPDPAAAPCWRCRCRASSHLELPETPCNPDRDQDNRATLRSRVSAMYRLTFWKRPVVVVRIVTAKQNDIAESQLADVCFSKRSTCSCLTSGLTPFELCREDLAHRPHTLRRRTATVRSCPYKPGRAVRISRG